MKKQVISFILGAIIFSTITAIAVTSINASDVEYDSTHSVKEKIDDLYTKVKPAYTGNVNITPSSEIQTLSTRGKYLNDDITVGAVSKISNDLTVEQVYSKEVSGLSSVTIQNTNNYKYYFLTNLTWHCSNSSINNRISSLNITSITNATYKELGQTKSKYGSSQSGAAINYIIYPDGSGNDIVINFSGADGAAVYGIK